MSEWHSREELEHRVVMLNEQGMSGRAIARALRIGRNRVKQVLARRAEERSSGTSAMAKKSRERISPKLDRYRGGIEKLLKEFPDITAQRIFEEIKARGYEGGYSLVKALVRDMRPKKRTISLPTPTFGPGEMAECDWSEYRISFTNGAVHKVHVFGYCLVYSRRKCFSIHRSQDAHALMDGHVAAFARLGGVAHRCKYDNMKTVVLHWEGRQPIYNPRFIDFATYYRFSPVACRPYSPNDKPRVERSFWELERSFLNGRKFRDWSDMEQQLARWMDEVCDQRRPRGTDATVLERFADESPHLRALPAHPYDTARVVYRVCDAEGCIVWEGNRYEVPYDYVGDILPVRITAAEVAIYAADLSCIASHRRHERGAHERSELAGRALPASRPRGPTMEQLLPVFRDMGPKAETFLAELVRTQRSAAYHARKILALRERYSTDDLVSALAHACEYQAFDHRAVERILRARSKPRRFDEYVAEATAKKLECVFQTSLTEPRSLAEYDALPGSGANPTHENGDQPSCHEKHPGPEPGQNPGKAEPPQPSPQRS